MSHTGVKGVVDMCLVMQTGSKVWLQGCCPFSGSLSPRAEGKRHSCSSRKRACNWARRWGIPPTAECTQTRDTVRPHKLSFKPLVWFCLLVPQLLAVSAVSSWLDWLQQLEKNMMPATQTQTHRLNQGSSMVHFCSLEVCCQNKHTQKHRKMWTAFTLEKHHQPQWNQLGKQVEQTCLCSDAFALLLTCTCMRSDVQPQSADRLQQMQGYN